MNERDVANMFSEKKVLDFLSGHCEILHTQGKPYIIEAIEDFVRTGDGEADIVWKYEQTKDFPKHNLLIEATLADSTNQRKMEMEPVSRHLGNYLLENQEHEAYCVFVTNNLNINVISDFRGRKSIPFYNSDGSKNVPGMMINPIETDVLVSILKSGKKYAEIYKIFHSHFENSLAPKEWYEELKNKLCR